MVNNFNSNVPSINVLINDDNKLEMFATIDDAIKRAEERDFLIRVYEKYYAKFNISKFEDELYELMRNYLKFSFK